MARQRPGRHWPWLVAGAVVLGALLVLYLHQPQGQLFFPRCSFFAATGLLCPGCGGLRAIHQLLHGEIFDAVRSNALLVLGAPAAILGWFATRKRPMPATVVHYAVWGLFAVLILYSVLRNLPWAPFDLLAPE
jgi:hypothetical protein